MLIFIMISDVDHVFTYLLAISMPSSEKVIQFHANLKIELHAFLRRVTSIF